MELLQMVMMGGVGYLVGGIPTGYWLAQWLFGSDITQQGSGNIGASNVARVHGKHYFVPVALLDAFKAFAYVHAVHYLYPANIVFTVIAVLALLVGNAYSPFLRFKGGKGVATTLGILAALYSWHLWVSFAAIWICIVVLVKKPYVASLVALLSLPLVIYLFSSLSSSILHGFECDCIVLTLLAGWSILRHRDNISNGS